MQLLAFSRAINWGDALFDLLKSCLFFSLFFQFIFLFSADEKNKFIFIKTLALTVVIFIGIALFMLFPSFETYLKTGAPININWTVASSLGNKNFFAETLFLLLPLIILSAFISNGICRVIFASVAIVNLLTIIALQTLSTWVALIIAFSALLILLIVFRKIIFTTPKLLRSFSIVLASVVVGVLLGAFVFTQTIGTAALQKRITTFQNLLTPPKQESLFLYQNSTYERIVLWKNSISIIGDYPFWGAGMANWKIINPSYGMGLAQHMISGSIRFTHPHNDLMLIGSESGLIGLSLFLAFLSLLFYYAWCLFRSSKNSSLFAVSLSAIFLLTGFIAIAFFSMPLSRIFPPILLMLTGAILISEYFKLNDQSSSFLSKNSILVILSISACISIGASCIGYIRLKSDFNLAAALYAEKNNNVQGMKRHLKTINKKVFPIDATLTPIAWFEGFASFYLGNTQEAFESFKEAEKVNPNHVMLLNDLGTCYNLNGDTKTAVQYYLKALKLQPKFHDATLNLAIVYYNTGKIDTAYSTLMLLEEYVNIKATVYYSTIILSKAQLLNYNELIISDLQGEMKTPGHVVRFFPKLKKCNGDIKAALENNH